MRVFFLNFSFYIPSSPVFSFIMEIFIQKLFFLFFMSPILRLVIPYLWKINRIARLFSIFELPIIYDFYFRSCWFFRIVTIYQSWTTRRDIHTRNIVNFNQRMPSRLLFLGVFPWFCFTTTRVFLWDFLEE